MKVIELLERGSNSIARRQHTHFSKDAQKRVDIWVYVYRDSKTGQLRFKARYKRKYFRVPDTVKNNVYNYTDWKSVCVS